MKTFKIIGKTNGWIAQRDIDFNGRTEVTIAEKLTLKEAHEQLLDLFNVKYDTDYTNWGLVRCHFPNYSRSGLDGTRSFEYDGRYFSIEEEFSIYDRVQEVKHREQEELAAKLRLYGEKVDDGYEWHFEGECPIVAAYSYDEPCDVAILAVRVDKDGYFTIIGDEKNGRGNEHEIEVNDVFAGHLDYIISEIGK